MLPVAESGEQNKKTCYSCYLLTADSNDSSGSPLPLLHSCSSASIKWSRTTVPADPIVANLSTQPVYKRTARSLATSKRRLVFYFIV